MLREADLVSWQAVYAKQAQKDAKKLAAAGLRQKAEALLKIVSENPFQTPSPYEKLVVSHTEVDG
jgi:toxin YoeB